MNHFQRIAWGIAGLILLAWAVVVCVLLFLATYPPILYYPN